jgi:Ca2+-binding EF-hand superfamily protein
VPNSPAVQVAASIPPESSKEPRDKPLDSESTLAPTDDSLSAAGHDEVVGGAIAAQNSTSISEDEQVQETSEAKPIPAERIAVLTPGGPVLIDVAFTLEGRWHAEVFNELIDEVLAAADTDKDGRSTWNELVANEKYLATSQPNGQPMGARQLKMLIEQYDEDRDDRVDANEAASWLGRTDGTAARAFRLRSSRWYHTNPRASSRVWQLLDSNGDARLTEDEISAAPEKFMLFDADDDRVIAPAELASLREQLDAANPQATFASRDATRFGAIHLDETVAADRLEYLLSDLYAARQTLGPGSFRGLANLFGALDANADQLLDQQELAELRTIEPHLRLSVAFNKRGEAGIAVAELKLEAHAAEVTVISQAANRLVISAGNTRLIISAQDLAASDAPAQRALQSSLSAMIHDQCDAIFEDIDANADGRLGEREITSCARNLARKDANDDGELAADELSHCMIVAFLRGEPPNESSFYIPTLSNAPPAREVAIEWFSRGDFNQDGDISRREFLGSLEQFDRLDEDHNGFISAEEAAAVLKKQVAIQSEVTQAQNEQATENTEATEKVDEN